jgi:hypothetical protein
MRVSMRTPVSLTGGGLLLTGSPAQAQGTWTDASDAGHVWAVGRFFARNQVDQHSLILRYDGTAWQPAARSGFASNDGLFAVDAVSATEAWGGRGDEPGPRPRQPNAVRT